MKLSNVIQVEFKRWKLIESKTYKKNKYRVHAFAPGGRFKEYVVGVLSWDAEEGRSDWLPCEGAMQGYETVKDARNAIRGVIDGWDAGTSLLNKNR